MEQKQIGSLSTVQSAADRLAEASQDTQDEAFEELASCILEHFQHEYDNEATTEVFSPELPMNIQRFVAAWLLRVLAKSSTALQFGNTERLTGNLLDRAVRGFYESLRIETNTQTYEKLQVLTDHMQSILSEANGLVSATPHLDQIPSLREDVLKLICQDRMRPLVLPILSRKLTDRNRMRSLFSAIIDYSNESSDLLHKLNLACEACDMLENEAASVGTTDAADILGGLARQLRQAVTAHFESFEISRPPNLELSPITKKYPLRRTGATVEFKIRISNLGSGPARDVRLDEVAADECLELVSSSTGIGTVQAGDTRLFGIKAKLVAPCDETTLLAELSWERLGKRNTKNLEFILQSQRDDIDWDRVGVTEPYSLEPITIETELIGRKAELTRLFRLASQRAVGSGFIYGQKRVGKTSLANALGARLESEAEGIWIVINKGSGDYVRDNANSTLKALGEVLVQAMKDRIPGLASVPSPDFVDGLAPLSNFVDQALSLGDFRILFILDEFDELQMDLFRRTELSTALFQPLRQISNKRGCGFILVGGEGMPKIVNLQGDRLNKFTPIEVDYFDKRNNMEDFQDLIRKPVDDWLDISDAALEELFSVSAGNPYFAKLVASQLFSEMVENTDCDASEVDMASAINKVLASIRANSFAHFWHDGLVEESGNADTTRLIRQSVLIAAGRLFRRTFSVHAESIWTEFKNGGGLPIEELRVRDTLRDFVRRRIMEEDSDGRLNAKIPLFQSWLQDTGVGELLEDSQEINFLKARLQEEEALRVKSLEIFNLCQQRSFEYQGDTIGPDAIRTWLDQFDNPQDERLMFRLLSATRFYDRSTIRSKLQEAYGIVRRNIRTVIEPGARVRYDILVSTLDDSAGKAGLSYCRLFASENRLSSESAQELRLLPRRFTLNQNIQRLVLIDDFCGTGRTITSGLEREMTLLKQANEEGIRIIIIALVGFAEARGRIERFIIRNGLDADVYFCDELGSEDKVFSDTSRVFPEASERRYARQVAEEKGVALVRRHPLGYEDSQAAIVFYESCPNNTLPIFWSNGAGWFPLFHRF